MNKYLLFLFLSLSFNQNIVLDISKTYFDGTPMEVIIYEYSDLYKTGIQITASGSFFKLTFERCKKYIYAKSNHATRINVERSEIIYQTR